MWVVLGGVFMFMWWSLVDVGGGVLRGSGVAVGVVDVANIASIIMVPVVLQLYRRSCAVTASSCATAVVAVAVVVYFARV